MKSPMNLVKSWCFIIFHHLPMCFFPIFLWFFHGFSSGFCGSMCKSHLLVPNQASNFSYKASTEKRSASKPRWSTRRSREEGILLPMLININHHLIKILFYIYIYIYRESLGNLLRIDCKPRLACPPLGNWRVSYKLNQCIYTRS